MVREILYLGMDEDGGFFMDVFQGPGGYPFGVSLDKGGLEDWENALYGTQDLKDEYGHFARELAKNLKWAPFERLPRGLLEPLLAREKKNRQARARRRLRLANQRLKLISGEIEGATVKMDKVAGTPGRTIEKLWTLEKDLKACLSVK